LFQVGLHDHHLMHDLRQDEKAMSGGLLLDESTIVRGADQGRP